MKPIELGSASTACRICPSDGCSVATLETFLPSSSSVWKLVSTPATDVRLSTSIVPLTDAPLTPLQLRTFPVKIDRSCEGVRFASVFDLFVTTQIAYLAMG